MDFHVFLGDITSHEHSPRLTDSNKDLGCSLDHRDQQDSGCSTDHGHLHEPWTSTETLAAVRPLTQTWSSVAAWAWTSHGLRW